MVKLNEYEIIKNSGLFDEDWYLLNYNEVIGDPIRHYIDIGSKVNYNPSPSFDCEWYLDKYDDVKKSNLNPFVHYIKYGQYENRFPNEIEYYIDNGCNYTDFETNFSILSKSLFFDEEFYLDNFIDVKNSKFSALEHYVHFGCLEDGRSPNGNFSNKFYKDFYLDKTNEKWNPLTHYELIGQFKKFKTNIFDMLYQDYSKIQIESILNAFKNSVSIVIQLFSRVNKEFFECLDSIRKNTFNNHKIFIINYTSDSLFLDDDEVSILNYNSNDFIGKVREYFLNSNSDVVFLSSYSKVTYNWLKKLILKAYSDENIDMVTPISNNLNDISSDFFNSINDAPFLTSEGLSKLIERVSLSKNIQIPFCNALGVYIKSNVLTLDMFNINSMLFNSDSCLFGWVVDDDCLNIIDDSTYIYHDYKFFEEAPELLNHYSVSSVYPKYLETYFQSDSLEKIKNNIQYATKLVSNKVLSNKILYIVGEDDLNWHNDFLTLFTKNQFDFYFLTFNKNYLCLWKFFWKKPIKLMEWQLNFNRPYFFHEKLKQIYFNILVSYNIDIIQINDFQYHSFDLVNLANILNISIVLNCADDFYLDGMGYDDELSKIFFSNKIWYENCEKLFDSSEKIIFANDFLKNKYLDNFKNLFNNYIGTIDNFDLNQFHSHIKDFNSTDKIKILILGNVNSKYLDLFKLIKESSNLNFEFHIFDELNNMKNLGVTYGKFSIEKFEELMIDFVPNFILFSDIFRDIFHVIDFAQNNKIPILSFNKELLIGSLDGLDGINIIDGKDSGDMVNNFIQLTSFENYYNNMKQFYLEDENFRKNIINFNKFFEDIYMSIGDSSKKIFKNEIHFKDSSKQNKLFSNFDGFLSNSYVSPIFEAEFIEEYKQSFAVMDNISKYLMNNVDLTEDLPLISVIMPVYNREDIVLSAVNSVLNQSYENFELIIVDDCSTDRTKDVLETIDDDRVSFIFKNKNQGPSNARNEGLKVAKGKYIAYLDSDNDWDSRYLKSMVGAFLELPDADAIYSGQLLYETYNSEPFAVRFCAYNKSLLHNRNYIDLNCFCHKRDIYFEIGGFDNNLKRLEDWDFILKISNDYKMYSVPILLSKYYYYNSDNRVTFAPANTLNYSYLVHEKNKEKYSIIDYELKRKINIIIPSYESLNDLRECIDTILSFNLPLVKIIIVDNNSSGAVKYYLNSLQNNDQIEVILNEINFGFTYAVNQGIELSDSDADILLLNNDALLTKGSLEAMQKYAYELPDCGLIVPQQILFAKTPTMNVHVPYASPIHECDVNPSQHHDNIFKIPIFHDGQVLELSFAPFFCTYIKRDVLNNSEGLDAELGRHYRSDRIFSEYVRHIMGLKIYHISDAHVYHKLQKSTNKLRKAKKEFDIMFVKNQWEPELLEKLNFKKALWDD